MTNLDKLKEIFPEVFGVEFTAYGHDLIYGCKLVNCPQPPYCESCSTCIYKGFWEQEYTGNGNNAEHTIHEQKDA